MVEYKIDKRKIVFNADFKPSIDFFSKQYNILKAYKSDFPNWEVTGLEFVVKDIENNCSANISSKKIIFEIEDANSKVDLAKKRIDNLISNYNNILPIEKILRAGIRFFIFVPMVEIKKEELADIIKSKLFLNNEEINDIFSKKIEDLSYIHDYSKEGFFYHFKCGPMPNKQIRAWVPLNQIQYRFKSEKDFMNYFESFPEISIFLDIDCYKKDIDIKEFKDFLTKAVSNCIKTATEIKKYLLGD